MSFEAADSPWEIEISSWSGKVGGLVTLTPSQLLQSKWLPVRAFRKDIPSRRCGIVCTEDYQLLRSASSVSCKHSVADWLRLSDITISSRYSRRHLDSIIVKKCSENPGKKSRTYVELYSESSRPVWCRAFRFCRRPYLLVSVSSGGQDSFRKGKTRGRWRSEARQDQTEVAAVFEIHHHSYAIHFF